MMKMSGSCYHKSHHDDLIHVLHLSSIIHADLDSSPCDQIFLILENWISRFKIRRIIITMCELAKSFSLYLLYISTHAIENMGLLVISRKAFIYCGHVEEDNVWI